MTDKLTGARNRVPSIHMASSSRKRTSSSPSSSKQPRLDAGEGVTPTTAARPHGRVVLNVGGQRFESSRSTLEVSSSYFQSLLARWDEGTDEDLFIDCDADAFAVLLSHMRIASNLILPKDEDLAARVLLLADYLRMDGLLAKVKARAYKNMHPEAEAADGTDPIAAFEAEVGSLQEAIDSRVLPARFFAPAPQPPEPPPKRIVKTLIPAPPGTHAIFMSGWLVGGQVEDEDGEAADSEVRDVLSFAVVQLRDGTTHMEAVVQKSFDRVIPPYEAHPQLENHLQFASEVCGDDGQEWDHHVIIHPKTSANRLPVSPGTIRAVWAKPAITQADVGKRATVTENGALIVAGEVRSVTWGDRSVLPSIKDRRIDRVEKECLGVERSRFRVGDGRWYHVPYLLGSGNQVTKDVAFVETGHGGDDMGHGGTYLRTNKAPAKFFIADSRGQEEHGVYDTNRLVEVSRVKMHDGMEFSHTITASAR